MQDFPKGLRLLTGVRKPIILQIFFPKTEYITGLINPQANRTHRHSNQVPQADILGNFSVISYF